jgi:hypothetical protein
MSSSVKNLVVKPINAKRAAQFVKANHYSGKVVVNSQLHFGVFQNGKLEGVLQYGPSLRKHFTIGLVAGTGWNEFLELNRMVFTDALPRNSESRCIAYTLRLIKKHYPHLKWIISFADGTQCGDGTIYRATGFVLTGIKKNVGLRVNPATGETMQQMQAYHLKIDKEFRKWPALEGYQFRYIYFLQPECRNKLQVEEIPFAEIQRRKVGMYKGIKRDKQAMTETIGTAAVQLRPSRSN